MNSKCKIGNLSSKMFFDWRIKHFDFIYFYFYGKHVYSLYFITLYELPKAVEIINYTTNQNNNNNIYNHNNGGENSERPPTHFVVLIIRIRHYLCCKLNSLDRERESNVDMVHKIILFRTFSFLMGKQTIFLFLFSFC